MKFIGAGHSDYNQFITEINRVMEARGISVGRFTTWGYGVSKCLTFVLGTEYSGGVTIDNAVPVKQPPDEAMLGFMGLKDPEVYRYTSYDERLLQAERLLLHKYGESK